MMATRSGVATTSMAKTGGNSNEIINEMMLKYLLDLSDNKKKTAPDLDNQTKTTKSHVASTTVQSNHNSAKHDTSKVGGMITADWDFFTTNKETERWADFDSAFGDETNTEEAFLTQLTPVRSYFEVWHKFFLAIKQLYDQIVACVDNLSQYDQIREYMMCVNETYLVFRRVLAASNKYVNKKQSHLDNNLKHEIEKVYSTIKRAIKCTYIEPTDEISSQTTASCSFCLHKIESNDERVVVFNFDRYHSSCINLWLNLVDSNTLPILKPTTSRP